MSMAATQNSPITSMILFPGLRITPNFLLRQRREGKLQDIYEAFAGLPVRKVVRATRFYSMLLQRLKNPRTMDDGIAWSAQADFVARLAEWDKDDVLWPLHRAERSALLSLNIPHFVSRTDASEISDATGFSMRTGENPGLARARARLKKLDRHEIDWQIEVIRENLKSLSTPPDAASPAPAKALDRQDVPARPSKEFFIAEADKIAGELSRYAVREGPGAAWIGLDWLGDAEVFQLVCLGSDLYNGTSGIAGISRRSCGGERP